MIKIITKCVLDIETNQWLPELEESYIYDGPVAYAMGFMAALPLVSKGLGILGGIFGHSGPSAQDKAIAKNDFQFMQTLQNEQNTQFANEQEAQNTLKTAWDPIIKGGAY